MPYISTERVKKIREELKREFPSNDGWTLSVTRRHLSGVEIDFMTAPFDMAPGHENKYVSVNHFYIEDHYKETEQIRLALLKAYKIANAGNDVEVEDSDYRSVPRFYVTIRIGKWDRPFVVKQSAGPKEVNKGVLEVQVIDYSEYALALRGNIKPIKDELMSIGGKFNRFLKNPDMTRWPGWIISKRKMGELAILLRDNGIEMNIVKL